MDDGFKIYTIKTGDHECYAPLLQSTSADIIRFVVKFDSSAIYKTSDSSDQCDINKLYGFTDCNSAIHENNARFGWRWINNQLELYAYCYSEGKVHKQFLTRVDIGEEINCMIKISKNTYLFQVNELPADTIPRGCSCDSLSKFWCYPYFGGNENAPHNITIKIKDL